MRNIDEQITTITNYYTRFYPVLQTFTGSAISTLIIGKLEFWFSKPKYVGGFYKFVEPCGHPLYREGDSWSEELGVSRKLFAKAFDLIGVRYNSKSAYVKAEDKFQGKFYASYHDRKTNRTYFVRNHQVVSQLIERLFNRKTTISSAKPQKKEGTPLEQEDSKNRLPKESLLKKTSPSRASSESVQGRSCNGDLGRSYAGGSFSLQKKTSSLNNKPNITPDDPIQTVDRFVTEEMINIWKEEVGELGVSILSQGLVTRLQMAFKQFFEGSLESWKAYCQLISSSKFLMGEAQNKFFKKAWITWAIRGENIEHIKGGGFKLGDRQTNHDKEIVVIDREIQGVECKKHHIEIKIAHIKSNEREKRKNIVKERIKNLSNEERQRLEHAFEAFLEQENNTMTEEFRKYRWKGMFISVYFDSFIEEKIYAQLFRNLDKDHDEKMVQSSGLLEQLEEVCHELSQIKNKKTNLALEGVTCTLQTQEFTRQDFNSPQNLSLDSNVDSLGFNPVMLHLASTVASQGVKSHNGLGSFGGLC